MTIDSYHDINDILFVHRCLSNNKPNDLPKFQIRKIEYNSRFPRNITEGQLILLDLILPFLIWNIDNMLPKLLSKVDALASKQIIRSEYLKYYD